MPSPAVLTAALLLLPAAGPVLDEVRQVQQTDLASWGEWRFQRRVEQERLAADGTVKSRQVFQFEVVPKGDGFDERLVRIDGREPTPAQVREHRKAGRFGERYRASRSTDEDARFSLRHLLELETYELAGRETIAGVECDRLDFSPGPAPEGATLGRRIAAAMEGTLWITREGRHVVRARAETTRSVKVAAGLAEVEHVKITTEQAAVGERWLPQRIEVQRTVRVLFGTRRRREVFVYGDFLPAGDVTSSVLRGSAKG